jgi:predicted AAA+ superfamily ATPase
VRRFFDSKNVQIYLTGSSAKLLSTEIATSLRGRSIATEILPFSFMEFMKAQQIAPLPSPLGKKSLDIMRQHLLHYFQLGGFPAVQHFSSSEHRDTLQSYVETVIFRDIVERHKVINLSLLRYFINFLLKNVGAPFSIHKFYNDIKSQGYKIGKDTLYNYLEYIQDAYLLFTVPQFTESVRESQTTSKKIYTIDNGLLIANTFNVSSNYGKLFENLVYLDLRRQSKEVFYYKTKSGYEIDFIVKSKQEKFHMYQVVWDLNDSATRQREERALTEAEKELGIPGTLLDYPTYLKFWN